MSENEKEVRIHRGLKGVYFERSETSFIDGRAGELRYRGYSIDDLARNATFEEIAYLLLLGELPTRAQLADFDGQLKSARELPGEVLRILEHLRAAHPMEVLRTAGSALGAYDPDVDDHSDAAVIRKGIRLTSQVPLLVAAHHRIRNGQAPVEPMDDLNHAAHFLYSLTGQVPTEDSARLMDLDMVLHAEHGSNASSFTARVVTGTDANLHAAVTAAIAALSGPAHGGAAENVMKMAEEIGDPSDAADYVRRKRAAREPIMGFGHRVYRTADPRAAHMRDGVRNLSAALGQPRWYEILEAVVAAMKPYARHGVNVNVDFYAGVVYFLHGIPSDLFVPIFAAGRVPGWVAQVLEQQRNNILIRPLTLYNGPPARGYPPLDTR